MSSKNKKIIILGFINVLLFFISFLLIFNDLINYFIVSSTITLISFINLCCIVFSKDDDKTIYLKKLKKILKSYDSILIYSDSNYEIKENNVIFVKKFEDLLLAQEELNKPLIYIEEKESSVFLLKEEKEILIYIMKITDDVESPFEYKIKNITEEEIDENILNELEKTTIIQLKNNKVYKVSPLK